MAKQMVGQAKFQVPGGQATPAPPVGTSLGRFGINLGQFVQQFNDRTREAAGMAIPVVVTVYNDRSFEFITKSPPAAAARFRGKKFIFTPSIVRYLFEGPEQVGRGGGGVKSRERAGGGPPAPPPAECQELVSLFSVQSAGIFFEWGTGLGAKK